MRGVGEWTLGFWDFGKAWDLAAVDVPDLDLVAMAKRNGAKQSTPYFLGPDGRADWRVNAFWRVPGVRGLKSRTLTRYAYSLKVWLDFLTAVGTSWDRAGRGEFAAFKEWRLSAEVNPVPVSPNAFMTDRAAIRRFYEWAAAEFGVTQPVGMRSVGVSRFRPSGVEVEGAASGVRRSDVKWLTPKAYRQWRTVGLQGFTAAGLPNERWKGRTEDRDVAFADGLFGTGLRLAEWSSLLTLELPCDRGRGLFRGQLAAACAKGSIGRPYWIGRRAFKQVAFYLGEGSRAASIARAQASGRYERIADRWLLHQVKADRTIQAADPHGVVHEVPLDALEPRLRMRLFAEGPAGLEPVWLWLNHDGTPRPSTAWHKTFARANDRVARALGQSDRAGRLWSRPHMLRHSFALRWYCIATFVAWQRTALMTPAEQRDFRDQLGDVWFLLATLLGHRSAETTRQVYLEPFQGIQIEQLVALMDADDRAALERLAEEIGAQEPRVLTEVFK